VSWIKGNFLESTHVITPFWDVFILLSAMGCLFSSSFWTSTCWQELSAVFIIQVMHNPGFYFGFVKEELVSKDCAERGQGWFAKKLNLSAERRLGPNRASGLHVARESSTR